MVCIAKAVVYVWVGEDIDDFGHASIDIKGADGNSTYVSFWPSTLMKNDKKYALFKAFKPYMVESYEEDIDKIKRKANRIILLRNLPNPNKYSIKFFKNYCNNHMWELTNKNCCYVVMDILKDMSGISPPQSWHGICSPGKVINHAISIKNVFTKDFSIIGSIGFQIDDSIVKITADKLQNNRKTGTSESLKLKFWATENLYDGKQITGYIFAEKQFDPLKGMEYFYDIKCHVPYNTPPTGKYYVVVTLNEYDGNDKWLIVDWCYFDGMHIF